MNGGGGWLNCRLGRTGASYGARPCGFAISEWRTGVVARDTQPLESPVAMIDFLEQAARSAAMFGQEALSGGNLWVLVLVVLVAIGVFAAVRGKLTESWLWIPLLAIAMWYAVYRWLQLRA